ncbi:MAG: glycine zipper domain-containing protein [Planctomycetota bacterium]|nr:glycine zipper domain-containing protein [Planctomycetota bacterium]
MGGNTGSTLIGAGVGAAAGYIIGNEMDKDKEKHHHHHHHHHDHGDQD